MTLNTPWGNTPTKFFFNLTPDLILNAVERLGYRCTGRCLTLNSMENRVYDVELDLDDSTLPKNSPERFVIVKFYRPGRWTKEQIQDEHDFLTDLVSNDIPVVAPIADANMQTLHFDEQLDLFYTLFPKIGGRSPDELDDEMSERVGRLLARMHGIGSTRIAKNRIKVNPQTYGIDNLKWLIDSNTLPSEHRERYQKVVESICNKTESWFSQAKQQRIHGDCHLGNLLWGAHGFFWVDFDDMVMGPPVQDLWLLVPGRDEYAQRKMRSVLRGYEMMAPFDRKTLRDSLSP